MEGGFVSSPTASLVFLAIGAGAIFQVVVVVVAIGRFIIHSGGGSLMAGPNVTGLATSMLIMYLTVLLI
jgi:ZIP family zinc transporter